MLTTGSRTLHCAVLDDYQSVALNMADWSPLDGRVAIEFHQRHFENEDDLVNAIGHCQIVVIMRERTPFRASLFARLPNLKLLITTGMRNASIDLAAAAAHGVLVCGTAGLSETTVELTWALILGIARSIVPENDSFRGNGPWQSSIGADLNGRCLGLLGLGKIGSKVARIGAAFGMEVHAWSPNLTNDRTDPLGVHLAGSKRELFERADFVSIHLVLGERSRGLVGAAELGSMRPTAYLINTSRAPIVDREALIQALQNRWIAGAALDVFETEPLPTGDILRSLPNVLATPHLGYVTEANYRIYYRDAVEDISAFLAGSPVRTL